MFLESLSGLVKSVMYDFNDWNASTIFLRLFFLSIFPLSYSRCCLASCRRRFLVLSRIKIIWISSDISKNFNPLKQFYLWQIILLYGVFYINFLCTIYFNLFRGFAELTQMYFSSVIQNYSHLEIFSKFNPLSIL